MSSSLIYQLRKAPITMRSISATVLIAFTMMILSPAAMAARTELEKAPQANVVHENNVETQMSKALQAIESRLQKIVEKGQSSAEDKQNLKGLLQQLKALDKKVLASFNKIKQHILDKQLSTEILDRHQQTVEKYQLEIAQLINELESVQAATDETDRLIKINAANEHLKAKRNKRSQQPFDPNNLPWFTPDASDTRKPNDTAEKLSAATGIVNKLDEIKIAANIITPEMLNQPGGPTINDLSETPDAKFSEIIKALADSLENNPVKIYEWVRNNIEYIPTYGSIQGASRTLELRKGNSFDISSLLIAMYRVSNIPARYAYGTVELPIEKVMNWVGGTNSASAAIELMGQGGIPVTAITQGGVIKFARFEHIWVESWVDYFPSRAAIHTFGDSWVALDPSFKLYDFTPSGVDVSNIGYDGKALIDSFGNNHIWDQSSQSVEIDSAFQSYFDNLNTFLDSYPHVQLPTLFGDKKVIKKESGILSSGLPYKVISRLNNFSEVPDKLRHKLRYSLSEFSDLINYEISLPEIAEKNISVSFDPATEQDKQALQSYLPIGTDISVETLPDTFPSYLIKLKANLNIDGVPVQTAGSLTFGTDVTHKFSLYSPNQGWQSREAIGPAGEYRSVGVDLQGIDSADVEDSVIELERLLYELDEDESYPQKEFLENLTQYGIKTYFAINDSFNEFESRANNVIQYRAPSFGYFHTNLNVNYFFGVPRSVNYTGVTFDVPRLSTILVNKNHDRQKRVEYSLRAGLRASYLENIVPEFMFDLTQATDVEGISAAKALDLALAQGQRIYVINSTNLADLNNVSIDSAARTNIRNAVYSGKEVTVHESPISINNWTGSGYLVLDKTLGSGGYLISGGFNGGFASLDTSSLLGILSLGIDFIPVVGAIKGIIELITGRDLVTGEPINRWLVGLATVASLVGGGALVKFIGKGGKNSRAANKIIKTGEDTVYINRSASGKIDYVGITNNFERRSLEHTVNGRKIKDLNLNLSRSDARAVEQALIVKFGGPVGRNGSNTTTQLTNIINSVSPKRTDYQKILDKGNQLLQQLGLGGLSYYFYKNIRRILYG